MDAGVTRCRAPLVWRAGVMAAIVVLVGTGWSFAGLLPTAASWQIAILPAALIGYGIATFGPTKPLAALTLAGILGVASAAIGDWCVFQTRYIRDLENQQTAAQNEATNALVKTAISQHGKAKPDVDPQALAPVNLAGLTHTDAAFAVYRNQLTSRWTEVLLGLGASFVGVFGAFWLADPLRS